MDFHQQCIIFTAFVSLFSLAPVGSIISNHYSTRVAVILGGLLAAGGLVLSSFATCLEYLYLSLGVLTGKSPNYVMIRN